MSENIILTSTDNRVATIRLNRPEALNALNSELMHAVVDAVEGFDQDPNIGAIVITGSDKAFAAGADIKQMQSETYRSEEHTSELQSRCDIVCRLLLETKKQRTS